MYAHILIATDGSDIANRAVEQGLTLAKALELQGHRDHRHGAVDRRRLGRVGGRFSRRGVREGRRGQRREDPGSR